MLHLLIILTTSFQLSSQFFFNSTDYTTIMNCEDLMVNYKSLYSKIAEGSKKFKEIKNWAQFRLYADDYIELNLMATMLEHSEEICPESNEETQKNVKNLVVQTQELQTDIGCKFQHMDQCSFEMNRGARVLQREALEILYLWTTNNEDVNGGDFVLLNSYNEKLNPADKHFLCSYFSKFSECPKPKCKKSKPDVKQLFDMIYKDKPTKAIGCGDVKQVEGGQDLMRGGLIVLVLEILFIKILR